MRIAITGAAGWVGRSANAAISQLIKLGHDLQIENYSANPSQITLIDGLGYSTKSYHNFDKSNFDLLIPLRFPTQEKFHILGEKKYENDVDLLIKRDEIALQNNTSAKVLLISSGVVNGLSESQSLNPAYGYYATMKKIQEVKLQNLVGDNNLNICYLYSCTSKDIKDFDSYAFSSIVRKALNNENIVISNALPVIRKYIDLRELFTVMILEILNGGNFRVSSGGCKIEIEELANLIVSATNSTSTVTRNSQTSNARSDIYFAEDEYFEKLFQKPKLKYSDLSFQIENVVKAVRRFV